MIAASPRRAVGHDLGAAAHHAIHEGADQDGARRDQAEAVGVDRAVVLAREAAGAVEPHQMGVEILDGTWAQDANFGIADR